jgi:transposase
LLAHSITNHVVDSSAIEVSRRQRRAKSDGLDVRKLLSMLMRYKPRHNYRYTSAEIN